MPMGSPVGLSEWHKPSGKNVERAKRKAGMNLRAACKVRRGEAGQPLPQPPASIDLMTRNLGVHTCQFHLWAQGIVLAIGSFWELFQILKN